MVTKICLMYYWNNAILTHKVNGAIYQDRGLPRWHCGKQSACQCRKCRFDPWVRKIPWRRKWKPTPVFLPGESNEQRSLEGYGPQGHKNRTRLKQLRTHTHPSGYDSTLSLSRAQVLSLTRELRSHKPSVKKRIIGPQILYTLALKVRAWFSPP